MIDIEELKSRLEQLELKLDLFMTFNHGKQWNKIEELMKMMEKWKKVTE